MAFQALTMGAAFASIAFSINDACAQGRGNLAESRDAVANGWLFDYRSAQTLARQTGKPMMVVFRCVP